jgi:hypothetical protein
MEIHSIYDHRNEVGVDVRIEDWKKKAMNKNE